MRAYLDNAATTAIHPAVAEAAQLASTLGNPSSLHAEGREARQLLGEARTAVAEHLGVDGESVLFTSGATESNNLALLGAARASSVRGCHIITSTIEHSAVRGPLRQLEREGFEVTELGVDRAGRINPQDVADALRPDTILVSIMLANNEIGTLQPIPEIRGAIGDTPFHCDAAQACGKVRFDLGSLGADFVTLSGHKMHGPRGVGVLYHAPGAPLDPITYGGSHEYALRPGTENVAGAVSFARALSLAHRELERNIDHMERLRSRLIAALEARIPDAIFHGSPDHRLPSIVNLSVPSTEGDAAVLALDAAGVAISAGSACEATSVEPSHVIRALGHGDAIARASIRLSLAASTSEEEVEFAARLIPDVLERLRERRG